MEATVSRTCTGPGLGGRGGRTFQLLLALGGSDHSSWEHHLCSVWTLDQAGLGVGKWWIGRQT